MKKVFYGSMLLLLILGASLVCLRTDSLCERATILQPGDDKARVISTLGRPSATGKVVGGPEWWAYDTTPRTFGWQGRFTKQFPWIKLMTVKLSPTTNDLAVHFDATGKVTKVFIPTPPQKTSGL